MRTLALVLTCAVLGMAAGCHWRRREDPQLLQTFESASEAFFRLAAAPVSYVPDAVLNRTKCVVIVPAGARKWKGTPAAATCRDESQKWESPALVTFVPTANQPTTVLLFVLSQKAGERLMSKGLPLEGRNAPKAGPVAASVVTVTDADLAPDVLSYVGSGSELAGKSVLGSVSVREPAAEIAAAEPPSAHQLANAVTSFFNAITPVGIILHHSAVIPGDTTIPTDVSDVDAFHRERGFDIICQGHEYNVAYHYLVLPDGTVKAGRPERCQGAHARGYNGYLGIALVGDFSSVDNPSGAKGATRPTPEQMRSLVLLCREIMQRYNIPLQRVLRHSDVGRTRCPGDRFPFTTLLRDLQGRG